MEVIFYMFLKEIQQKLWREVLLFFEQRQFPVSCTQQSFAVVVVLLFLDIQNIVQLFTGVKNPSKQT